MKDDKYLPESYISVDPGTTNLAWGIFTEKDGNIEMLESGTESPKRDPNAIVKKANKIAKIAADMEVECAILEFQPAFGTGTAIRWNSFVEGCLYSAFAKHDIEVKYVYPGAVKRKFKLASGNHSTNKLLAIEYYKEKNKGKPKISSHLADCYINFKYFIECQHTSKT